MVVMLNTGLPRNLADAIELGKPDKWNSAYHFLQIAAAEKLEREGFVKWDSVVFIHYTCPTCGRHIYVLPEVAGLYEWLYCTKCYPAQPAKENALIRNGAVQGKEVPHDAEIRRW